MSNRMDTVQTLLPKLRFPEFQDEWEQYFGSQLFDPINNKEHDSSLPVLAITQEHGAIPRDLIDYQVSVTDKSIASYKVVEVGDFIISLRSFQGGIEYSEYMGICSPAYIILRKKNDISEAYFKYFFKTERFIQQLQKNLEGLRDGKMVSYQQFSELLLPTPSTAEQQKIADCLTSLDAWIAAQSQKVEALKAYKKGLMQNLFPAEGESVPRLRFPEFEDAGEWEEKTLGDVSKIYGRIGYRGYTVEDIVKKGEGAIALSPSNINDEVINVESSTYISWYKYEESPEIKVENGDILFVKTGSTYGKTALVVNLTEKATVNPQVVVIKEIGINNMFLGYVVSASFIKKQVEQIVVGGAVPTMSQKETAKMKFMLPTKPEQQRIADFLTSIDEQISAQSETVAALKVHKKGLMQGLFPRNETSEVFKTSEV